MPSQPSSGNASPEFRHQHSATVGHEPYGPNPYWFAQHHSKERILSITVDTNDDESKEQVTVIDGSNANVHGNGMVKRDRSSSQDYVNVLHLLVGHGFYSRKSWNSFQELRKFQKSNNK